MATREVRELQAELQRLSGTTFDAQGAASVWATGAIGMDLVGALNVKAGNLRPEWRELAGVLNQLAGTRGAGVGQALSSVDNVLRLPGVSGNYVSTPDSVATSITGDIDIRAKVALDDWTPGADSILLSKYDTTGNQRSWAMRVTASGSLIFVNSVDGTATTSPGVALSGVTNGQVKWIRVTRVAATGTVAVYVSDDGATWTTLASSLSSTAGALFDSTAALTVGGRNAGTAEMPTAYVYQAEVRNGIDGPVVAKFDATAVPVRGTQDPTTVTQDGTVWTVNGTSWWWGTYTGTQRYANVLVLDPQYVYFPGTTGNYASTPDSAALSITGDIDLRAKVAPDSWASGATQTVIGKWTSGQRSYRVGINATGFMFIGWSTDGTAQSNSTSTAAIPGTNGTTLWIRVARVASTGVSTFYTSADGVTWTQLGSTVTTSAGISFFDGTAAVEIASQDTGAGNMAGKVYYAEIRNGIGGTVVGNFKPTTPRVTAVRTPTTWTGEGSGTPVWTLNGSAWEHSPTVTPYISTPDSAALSITGDIDLRVKVTMNDWLPLGLQYLMHKRSTGGYGFRLGQGLLEVTWHDGTNARFVLSSVAVPFSAGQTGWVRATLDVDNGSGGHAVNFYTSTDGVTWTLLGAADRNAGAFTTSIGDSTDVLEIGSGFVGGGRVMGTIHYAEIRSGIGGTVVGSFDPNRIQVTGPNTPTTVPGEQTYTISGSGWRWRTDELF